MSRCPFCQSEVANESTNCPSCHAKKGYLRLDNLIFGKSLVVLFGFILPSIIILYSIAAQNIFGVWMSIAMILPILFGIGLLVGGTKWFKRTVDRNG